MDNYIDVRKLIKKRDRWFKRKKKSSDQADIKKIQRAKDENSEGN